MDRQTLYAYEAPLETDFLYGQRFAYEGLGLALLDLLGSGPWAAGLGCVPTSPASLQVKIQPGRIYSAQNLEPTAWGLFNAVGGLAADTNPDHQILKQGIYRDTTTLASMPAPVTVGQSINYLIEAAFSEVDANSQSINFVSSTSPYAPIAPSTLNTQRQDQVVITVKAGTPAATGTQTTPAVDSGNVGLYVVTVAYGQSAITSASIAIYPGAPFIIGTQTQRRTQLAANTTFYVDATNGNDSNNGLAAGSGHAWATIQHALNVLQQSYDLNGYVATVQVADGTYAAGASVTGGFAGAAGAAGVVINGDSVTPSNVIIGGSTGFLAQEGAKFTVQNMLMNGNNVCLESFGAGSEIFWSGIVFAAATTYHLLATRAGYLKQIGNYSITGGATAHASAAVGLGVIEFGAFTTTITGTPAFSNGFAFAKSGNIIGGGATFAGTGATGSRYSSINNGIIDTSSAGASYFPGNSAGATSVGGIYV